MQGQRQGALWELGPAGQREHQLRAHQPGGPSAACCRPATSSRGAHDINHTQGSANLWGFVAIGMQLNHAPQPGQVVRAFAGVLRDMGMPIEGARVEFVRYTTHPGKRSLAHLRLPPPLARALLAARCRLSAVHPGITLDLYRKKEERLYIRQARDQRAPQRQTASAPAPASGRADAAATWTRAPPNAQPAPLAPTSGTSGSIGDPYDSGPWGERAFLAMAPSCAAADGNPGNGSPSDISGDAGNPPSQAPDGSSGGGGSSDDGNGGGSDGNWSADGTGSSQGSNGSAAAAEVEGGWEGLGGQGRGGGVVVAGEAGAGAVGEAGAARAGEQRQPTTSDGEERLPAGWWRAECIVDQRARRWTNRSGSGQVMQYRVRFAGHGPEADEWIKADRVSRPLLAAWDSRQRGVVTGGGGEAPANAGGSQAAGMAGNPAPAAAQSAGARSGDGRAASRRSRRLQAAALASQ